MLSLPIGLASARLPLLRLFLPFLELENILLEGDFGGESFFPMEGNVNFDREENQVSGGKLIKMRKP